MLPIASPLQLARGFVICAVAVAPCAMLRSQNITASVPTTAGGYALTVNSTTNKIYVVSNTKDLVTVIDGATNATSTVNVGQGPTALDIDTSTNKVFVANTLDSTVTEIDGTTNATTTITLIGQPISVAVNSSTHQVYVPTQTYNGDYAFGALEVIDEATGSVTLVDGGLTSSTAIAINTTTNTVYIGALDSDPNNPQPILTVVNGANNTYTGVGPSNRATAVTVDAGKNVVVVSANNGSGAYNTATGIFTSLPGVTGGLQVVVDEVTHQSYYSNGSVVDDATLAVSSVDVPVNVTGVAVDGARGKVLYSEIANPAGLVVLDLATDTLTTLMFGTGAVAVAENPSTGLAYVLSDDSSSTVTVVDIAGSSAPLSVAYGPQSQTVAAGTPVALNAVPQNSAGVTFQWALNGVPLTDGAGLSGSTTGTLYISRGAVPSDAGSYSCTLTNSTATVTTAPATLAVASGAASRLVNLSSRAEINFSGGGSPIPVTAGFGISGTSKMNLILRGDGPALIALGVETVVTQPTLTLYDGASSPNLITTDTGWQNPPSAPKAPWAGVAEPVDATLADFQAVGAFALTQGFGDDAVKVALPVGTFTEVITAPPLQSMTQPKSTVLAEIYDADSPGTGSSLTNLSTQAYTSGASIPMTVGFVISGSASMTILLRVSGPALAPFGVTNFNAAPVVNLYDSNQNVIESNASWQGNAQVAAAAARSGAFAWTNPSSHDDAILVTLAPGNYTASVVGTTSGMSLLEVYAVSAAP
jgi:hypothetical protein